jgi:hypothetical protein
MVSSPRQTRSLILEFVVLLPGHPPNERIPNVLEEGCSSARTRAKCHDPEETPTACHLHIEIYERRCSWSGSIWNFVPKLPKRLFELPAGEIL